MDQYQFSNILLTTIKSLKENQVINSWLYKGKTDIAYGTPNGPWDVDGYLFEKKDNKYSYVLRSVPKQNGSCFIVLESVNLRGQLYNMDLSNPKNYKENLEKTYLLESYRMTAGKGKKKEIDVKNAFKVFNINTNEITILDDTNPNWLATISDILEWAILRENVKVMVKDEKQTQTEIVSALELKKNIALNQILYGPPGTGKTYNTVLEAAKIITGRYNLEYNEALNIFNLNLGDQIEFITFHQNYSYEDFIQGLRPDVGYEGGLSFEKKDGVFKRIADRAHSNLLMSGKSENFKLPFHEVFNQFIEPLVADEVPEIQVVMTRGDNFSITKVTEKNINFRKPTGGTGHNLVINRLETMYNNETMGDFKALRSYYGRLLEKLLELGKSAKHKKIDEKNYVIIIDEINRANISRVFGELITLIEEDKRSHGKIPMRVTLPSGDTFIVPSNLYIIGTMNTADKSIALLDIALRRRFNFVPKFPDSELQGVYNGSFLTLLNKGICEKKGRDFQIGHAYFMENEDLNFVMNNKVIPLLLEYFMNDEKTVKELVSINGCTVDSNVWPMKFSKN
jgi:hypothetical protein